MASTSRADEGPLPTSPSSAPAPAKKRKHRGDGPSPSAARSRAFQPSHARRFGLQVVARDEASGAPTAVLCLFCKHFGREERPGKQRRPTTHFKYFRQSFRSDLYVQHHSSQHPTLWAQYDALADDDERKRRFFPAPKAVGTPGGPLDGSVGSPTADQLPLLHDRDVAEAAAAARRSPDQRQLWFELNAGIVDLVVAADGGGPPHSRDKAPSSGWTPAGFRACSRGTASPGTQRTVPISADGPATETPAPVPVYRVGLFSREPLELAVDQFAGGLSPRQVARSLAAVATRVGRAADGTADGAALSALVMNGPHPSDLARLCVAASLQRLGTLLAHAWGFSLEVRTVRAVASASRREAPGDTLLELRAAVYVEHSGDVQDLHLVAFPDAGAHSAAALGTAAASLLDAMLPSTGPSWRGRVVGVSADGLGLEDHGTQVAEWLRDHIRTPSGPHPHPLPVRMWAAAPHVHRALQTFYASLLSGGFLPTWRRLVARIQSDPALIQEMGRPPSSAWATSAHSSAHSSAHASSASAAVRIPMFNPHRWLDLGRDAKWVTDKRVRLRKALGDTSPPDAWWVAFFVVHWVAGRADDALECLRAGRPHASAAAVADLAAEIATAFRARPPSTPSSAGDAGPQPLPAAMTLTSHSGRYAVAVASTREFVDDLGLFVSNVAARVDAVALDRVLAGVALGVAELVDALVGISGGGGPSPSSGPQVGTDADPPLPPTDPLGLAALSGRELVARLAPMAALFADEEARDAVDQEHQALRRAVAKDGGAFAANPQPAAVPGAASAFVRAWGPTSGRFPRLQAIAGAVATASAASARLGDLWERGLGVPGRRYGRDMDGDADADADADADDGAPMGSGPLAGVVDLTAEVALHAQQWTRLDELAAPTEADSELLK